MIGAELLADLQPVVARAGEDDRLRAERLGHRHAQQADRAGPRHDHALACDQAAKLGQAVHGRAGGDDQRRLLVGHVVGDRDQRVDVVDLVLAEAAVGGEAVGAMALVDVAVVEAVVVARGIHALAAALALAAAGVNFHRDALADLVFVDAGTLRHHRAHVLMARRPVLVERQAALDQRRRPVGDHVEVGGADRDRIDAHQHLGLLRHRHRLVLQRELAGIAQHPRLHRVGNREVLARLHSGVARTCVPSSVDLRRCRLRPAAFPRLCSPNSAESARAASMTASRMRPRCSSLARSVGVDALMAPTTAPR